jgi:triacylglycerol lipase
VTSLTTIGTPHKGTPLADGRLLQDLQPVLAALNQHGIDIRGFLDLTPAAAQGFEADAPDAVAVRYFSVAGHYFPGLLDLLKAPHDLMRLHGAGDNDGLVPVASATHGERLGVWAVNHFRLVNWATNLLIPPIELLQSDVLDGYLGIVDALSARGL